MGNNNQALHWEKLNPEVSSWKKIVEAAEHYDSEVSKGEGSSKKGHPNNKYHSSNNNAPKFRHGNGD
jgi:hypothetical protein